jgi:hypothetical protein
MVLFRVAARSGHLRVTPELVGWYVVVSVLHGFWDMSNGLAALITSVITRDLFQQQLLNDGRLSDPSAAEVHVYTVTSWGLLIVDAVIGVLVLRMLHRRTARSEARGPAPEKAT